MQCVPIEIDDSNTVTYLRFDWNMCHEHLVACAMVGPMTQRTER